MDRNVYVEMTTLITDLAGLAVILEEVLGAAGALSIRILVAVVAFVVDIQPMHAMLVLIEMVIN